MKNKDTKWLEEKIQDIKKRKRALHKLIDPNMKKQIRKDQLLRWSNNFIFSETSRGIELGSEISLLNQFSERSAISYNVGAWGYTLPTTTLDSIRLSTRYRRGFYRPWLFYEIEPEFDWLRNDQGDYKKQPAISFRIEIQFERY